MKPIVDANLRAIKLAMMRDRTLSMFTSEITRGAYRSKAQALDFNMLAAFKESGAIEYGVETAIVLIEDGELVRVEVPKNRRYKRVPFALKLDSGTALLSEVPIEDAIQKEIAEDDRLRERALTTCRLHDIMSGNQLAKAMKMNKAKGLRLCKELVEDGSLVRVDGRLRPGGSGE